MTFSFNPDKRECQSHLTVIIGSCEFQEFALLLNLIQKCFQDIFFVLTYKIQDVINAKNFIKCLRSQDTKLLNLMRNLSIEDGENAGFFIIH